MEEMVDAAAEGVVRSKWAIFTNMMMVLPLSGRVELHFPPRSSWDQPDNLSAAQGSQDSQNGKTSA